MATSHVMLRIVSFPGSSSTPLLTVRPVLSKVMSGCWSTSKKLTDRRSSSRMRFAVFTELMEIVAVAEQSVGCSAILR
jgi:hypothetical protein